MAAKKRYAKRGFSRLSDHAKYLIRAPLTKRGFAQSRLLTEWDVVVGAGIASLVRPLRLSHAAREGMGGTLTLGVTGARALEAQHLEQTIIERVNAHYGYRAVARIRLSQVGAEVFNAAKLNASVHQPTSEQERVVRSVVSGVADDDLRDALERLGRNIAVKTTKNTSI